MTVQTAQMVEFVHTKETDCPDVGRRYSLAAIARDGLVEMPRPGVCWYCGCEPWQLTPTDKVLEMIRGKLQ